MNSCIYHGLVKHRRMTPVAHAFTYRLFMMFVDLDELPTLFKRYRFWSGNKPTLAWFNRRDHFGSPEKPLKTCVQDLVEQETGSRPTGPICLLTHFRYFGYCFNPVSFYYCFSEDGRSVEQVVAEVSNTPWGERHCYVLGQHNIVSQSHNSTAHRHPKAFHVSPFLDMRLDYLWRIGLPGPRLALHIANFRGDERVFDATLTLHRKTISAANLRRVLWSYPLMTLKVMLLIHIQAVKLWLKKIPVVPHPKRSVETPGKKS